MVEAHRKSTNSATEAVDGEVSCRRPGRAQMLVSGANERGDARASYSHGVEAIRAANRRY